MKWGQNKQTHRFLYITGKKFFLADTMALVSADTKIAELLNELHQLIKQTQVSTTLFLMHDHCSLGLYVSGNTPYLNPVFTLISLKYTGRAIKK